jgi:hypothetical protein
VQDALDHRDLGILLGLIIQYSGLWQPGATRAVPLACTTDGITRRASSVTGTATDMYGLG